MKNFQNKTKIVKVSKVIRSIFFAGLILWIIAMPLALATILIQFILHTNTHTTAENYKIVGNSLTLPFVFAANLYFFKFFNRLKNGCLFDAQTIGYLQAAGKWLIALGLFQILFAIAAGLMTHSQNVTVSGDGIFSGLVTIFTAWLFREGQELQEEQELTV
jgi:Protein of unknown function (DUF2975)